MRMVLAALLCGFLVSGCIARAAYDVVTLPVRAGSQAVDWATTSQDEADRNRGRKLRKQEKRERKAARKQAEAQRREIERDRPY